MWKLADRRRGVTARLLMLRGALGALLALAAVAGSTLGSTGGSAIVEAADCNRTVLPRNDDGFSPNVALPFSLNFYGRDYSSLWVNNNGNVTFDGPLSTYTPFQIRSAGRAIIAPFFGDVDTRGSGSDVVRYGYGTTVYEGRPAFCVNWINVGYYAGGTDKLNSFQLLLVQREDAGRGDFDIVFNYGKVQWEAGSASGGSGGLGGTSARVGFANGDGSAANSFELDGSGVRGRLLDSHPLGLIHASLGSDQLGRYTWRVRGGRPRANRDPVAAAGADATFTEGDTGRLDAAESSDPDGDVLTYAWERLRGTGPASPLSSLSAVHPTFDALDDGTADYRLTVQDGNGGSATDEVSVAVVNAPPQVSAADVSGAQGGASVLAATFSDAGVLDRHTATVDWGDGSAPEPAAVTDGTGWGTLVAAHRYDRAGRYEARVRVADGDGGHDEAVATVTVAEPSGLWATDTSPLGGIDWSGSDTQVRGLVHSNSALRVTGSDNRVDGTTRYATSLKVAGRGNTFTPPAQRSATAEAPVVFDVADYRPGGRAAREVGAQRYFDHTPECEAGGSWTVAGTAAQLPAGVHYAPCGVHLAGDRIGGEVTIVAERQIQVSGTGADLRPYLDGVLLLSGSAAAPAIHISGSRLRLTGYVQAAQGVLQLSGADGRFVCGMLGRQVRLTGARHTLQARDCTRPAGAVALSTVVPSPKLGIEVDRAAALPGDALTYTATLTNAGATLVASGLVGAEALGGDAATVASYAYVLEYQSASTGEWAPLASASAAVPGFSPSEPLPVRGGVRLQAQPVPSPGVTYGDGDSLLGTRLTAGGLAAWGYQARVELTPAEVRLLQDPARVSALRNSVHLEFTGSGDVRELYRLGGDFAPRMREDSGALEDSTLTIAPPVGDGVRFGAAELPELARLAPGESATATLPWEVPVVTSRAETESVESFLARLRGADGAALRGAARAFGRSGDVRLPVGQTTVTTRRRLPVLTLDKTGPETLRAGDQARYDIAVRNVGSAAASGVTATDDATGRGLVPVTGVQPALDPGASTVGRATFPTQAGVLTPITDRASVVWTDGNGNRYGAVDDSVTTRMTTPSAITATMEDRLEDDADQDGAVTPGDVVGYEVVIANTGTSPVESVAVAAPVAAGSSVVTGSANASQGEIASDGGDGAVRLNIGTLAGRRNVSLRYHVRVADPLAAGITELRTQARVTSRTLAEVLSDDLSTDTRDDATVTPVRRRTPRLSSTMTASLHEDADADGSPSPGDTLRYAAEIVNQGDAPATGVTFSARPGDHTSLVPGSVSAAGGTVVAAPGEVRARFDSVPGRGRVQVAFDVVVGQPPRGVDRVSAQGSVASHELAPFLTDDPSVAGPSDPTVTRLVLPPRVVAEQTDQLIDDRDGNGAVSPGDRLRYTVRVTNEGDGTATGVHLTFTLDASTTLVPGSVTTTQGSTESSGREVRAELGEMGPAAQATVTFDADLGALPAGQHQVVSQGSVSADGQAASSTDDPAAPGGGDATVTPVANTSGAPPALVVQKRDALAVDADGDGVPSPGDTLSYEIGVWNAGDGAATDVELEDVPDANTALVTGSVQAAAGATVAGGNAGEDARVSVRVGTLAPASGTTVTFQVRVRGALPAGVSSVSNQARLTSAELAPVTSVDPDGRVAGGATVTELTVPAAPAPSVGAVAPADGSTVTAPLPVRATIVPPSGQTIDAYCVRVAQPGEPARTLACGEGAPAGDLATLDPTTLPNGTYVLTVEATASGGGVQRESVTLAVTGDLKPARFVTTYLDLAAPVHGMPLEVRRTYDSFDRSAQDFGVGWKLDVAGFDVQVNRPLGRGGWSHQPSGCVTFWGQTSCFSTEFEDLSSHFVTVTWPDGRAEVFDFTPVSGSGGVYYDASAAFTGRRGTTSKLEPVDDATLQYWGDGNLFESDGETLYDPRRFRLTTKDGTSYLLDVTTGLVSLEDRHGNTVRVDADGITSSTGRSIRFTRDAGGRITRVDGPAGERRTYAYSSAGDLVSTTDGSGRTVAFEYDGEHLLRRTLDGAGRPMRTLTYDDAGRLASITDGEGNRTELAADVDARREVITWPGGRLSTITSFDARGNPVEVQEVGDGRTRTRAYGYDEADRLVRVVDPAGRVTRSVYDGSSNLVSSTDPAGRTTRYEYDGSDQLVKVTAPDGLTVNIERDDVGDPVRIDEGAGRVTQLTYDLRGLVTGETDPAGRHYTTAYDAAGNPTEMRGPSGVVRATYDASSRMLTQTDETGVTTTFGYDADGRLGSVRDARGGSRSFTYDALGRVETEKDALGAVTRHAYDLAGRRTATTDRTGAVTTFTYDASGRSTGRSGAGENVEVRYDAFGRMTSASNTASQMSFRHDDRDLVTSITTGGAGLPSTTVAYTYDAAGAVESMDGPGGLRRYRYDAAGRLSEIADSATGTFTFGRDAMGRVSTLSRPNGVTTALTYNAAGQATDIVHRSAAGVLDEAHYTLDARGLRTEVRDAAGTRAYQYDAAGQLTSAPGEAFGYDLGGNRTGNGEVYDGANRLVRDAQHSYAYDAEGRLTSRTDSAGRSVRFAWNGDGSLRSVEDPDGALTRYRYDPLGRRIEVSGPAGTRRLGYGTEPNAVVEYDAANAISATFAFGPGLDAPLVMRRGGQAQYHLQDALSSVTALADASGSVSQRYRYSAYGKPLHGADPTGNPYTYTGREWDAASATYHYRARSYDPAAGRFISEDPIRALNPYAYATNNPLTFRDPTGEMSLPEQNTVSSMQSDLQAAGQTHMHHTVPRQLLKQMDELAKKLTPKDKNLIRGKQGCPNRWAVAIDHHVDIHRGPGGGTYNHDWMSAIDELGGWEVIEVSQILDIREQLARKFNLRPPDPDYFTRCRGMA